MQCFSIVHTQFISLKSPAKQFALKNHVYNAIALPILVINIQPPFIKYWTIYFFLSARAIAAICYTIGNLFPRADEAPM